MISTITLSGQSVTLVAMPTTPAPRMIERWIDDTVAVVDYPFSGQKKTQEWAGADRHGMTVTMPGITDLNAPAWRGFLMQMRGQLRAVQVMDYAALHPQGSPGASVPLVDSTTTGWNVGASKVLHTKGWLANRARVLLPGDALQIGYRLHYVLDVVSADNSGKASFEVFPSLRETVADGTAIILNKPKGLFRLGANKRNWSYDVSRVTRMSFQLEEYR